VRDGSADGVQHRFFEVVGGVAEGDEAFDPLAVVADAVVAEGGAEVDEDGGFLGAGRVR
jgi:disulfide oxidoreductase YuzD